MTCTAWMTSPRMVNTSTPASSRSKKLSSAGWPPTGCETRVASPQKRSRFAAIFSAPVTKPGPPTASGPRSTSPHASGASTSSRPLKSPFAHAAMNFSVTR